MDTSAGKGGAESQYNLNESTFILIGDLQREAISLANRNKNYDRSFDRWQSIRLLISQRFEVDETNKLDELEEDFEKEVLIKYPQELGEQQRRIYNHKTYYQIKKKRLHKYVSYLMVLMRIYKIGPTDLQKKTRMN